MSGKSAKTKFIFVTGGVVSSLGLGREAFWDGIVAGRTGFSTIDRFDTEGLILDLPTGVGFCMGMSAEALSRVGFLDRVSFGRGYGEENDWCLRAELANFRNAIVPNLYVHHKRGGTFPAAEKREALALRWLAVPDRNRATELELLHALEELESLMSAADRAKLKHLLAADGWIEFADSFGA
jgi:GT2 family glycosyltransferase